ncbi:MAG: hypothetical protein NWQ53_04030, partial [Flavobacteriales bacterium]|nr:hypothetical protein [Flavobacteriales bacterium]
FTIVQPAPSLIYPNGGETVYQNQTRNITWTNTYFNSSFVKLEYSLDNGGSWTTISTAANNTGTYSWVVPALISQNALVRVSEFNNPSVFDVSDEVFSIEESIIVTSPNGDNGVQDWRVCTETTITWTSGGTSNYFKIFYSLNNGLTWTALETNYYSPGFTNAYDWVMPNSPGPGALVRVEDRFNAAQFDVSDANFTIAPAITVVSPNGGEVLGAGDVVSITWLNEGASNLYDIDYSINGGGSWNNIVFNQFIGGSSYDWVLPASLSSNYLIRVRDHVDNCKEDLSNSAFEVGTQSAAQVQLTNPTGGEDFAACESVIVTWNSIGTSNFFNLDYSLDGGLTWTNIVENHFTLSGTYNWSVPNFYSNNLILRVMDTQASAYNDQTSIPMSIAPAIANAGLDKNICLGESVFLQATGGVSYSWSPAIGLDDATSNSPAASPNETTTYTLTITDQNGCQASDDIVVSVNTDCEISGCIDETAYNYNPLATTDSGFCLYTQGNGGGNNSVCPSDFNNDGITNLADLLIFLNNIGTVCSQ